MESRIIGIGGVFIKFNDPKKMNEWYSNVLGMTTNDYGVLFSFNNSERGQGFLQLGTFPENSDYFGEATQRVMLNFRVQNLEHFLEKLKKENVKILDEMETYEYGKFIHISDPEGNRIELWEPIDSSFSKEPSTEMF